jgi:parallel beta-helix repeat protein
MRQRSLLLTAILLSLVAGSLATAPSRALENAAFVSQSGVPTTMTVGEQRVVTVTMKNTGTTTWTRNLGYKLGSQNPQDNFTWGFHRVWLSSSEAIGPGQQKSFTFTITAPSTPGSYNFQWRMVHELVTWFGQFTPNQVIQVNPAAADDADFVSQANVPSTMTVGEQRTVTVTMKNTGTATWTRSGNYRLGSQNPQDNLTWGIRRVLLPSTDSIPQGQQKSFTFTITAPSTAGSYNFQWRMVHELVKWFGDFTPNRVIQVTQPVIVTLCPGVTADANFGAAAHQAIQQCIDQTPGGGTLEIPAGTYRIGATVSITKPMTFRTAGTAGLGGNCEASGVSCASLKADAALFVTTGILNVRSKNVALDHLIVDGNRNARLSGAASASCQDPAAGNRAGTNIFVAGCTNCSFTKSVTKEALCGTGLSWRGDGARITNSVVRNNGNGVVRHLWADGLTLLQSNNAVVTNNLFANNSDVSFIMGGSTNSTVTGNTLMQTDRRVFAAFMLSNFRGSNTGDFTGTTIANNSIHCANELCDFGIQLGEHAWQVIGTVVGGTVRDNSVANALQPINIDGTGTSANPVTVYGNTVSGFVPRSLSCGPGQTSEYNINTADSVVNRNGETTTLTERQWHQCSGPGFVAGSPIAQIVNVNPVADAWVEHEHKDANHGLETSLYVRADTTGQGRSTYLRFTVSGVTGIVQSAKLRIRTRSTAFPSSRVYYIGTNTWVESGTGGITWNNAPLDALLTYPIGALAANVWHDIDVSSIVTGNGTYTLGLVAADQPGLAFWSRESSNPPRLVVTSPP